MEKVERAASAYCKKSADFTTSGRGVRHIVKTNKNGADFTRPVFAVISSIFFRESHRIAFSAPAVNPFFRECCR